MRHGEMDKIISDQMFQALMDAAHKSLVLKCINFP
jgi:hypothetical protein